MSRTRLVGFLMLAAGGLLAVGGGYTLAHPAGETASLRERRAAAQAELDSTRAQLRDVGILYQGYRASMKTLPDSVRKFGLGPILEQGRIYQKRIGHLEFKERDLTIDITGFDRRLEAAEKSARVAALRLGGTGLALILGGAVLLARARGRPVAA